MTAKKRKTWRDRPRKTAKSHLGENGEGMATHCSEPEAARALVQRIDDLEKKLAEHQARAAAAAEILHAIKHAIKNSKHDTQPVFDLIARQAANLCGAAFCAIWRSDGRMIDHCASHGFNGTVLTELRSRGSVPLVDGTVTAEVVRTRGIVRLKDPSHERPNDHTLALRFGIRQYDGVPITVGGEVWGVITLAWPDGKTAEDAHTQLVQTLADQASIAIGNARLFDEVRARTAEVTEALAYQTAPSEVLQVISRSPNDIQPVLEVILQVSTRLCCPTGCYVSLRNARTGLFDVVAMTTGREDIATILKENPVPPSQNTATGRVAATVVTVYIPDVENETGYEWIGPARQGNYRSALGVPLLEDGQTVGTITIAHAVVNAFSKRQIAVTETFAAQAVIASAMRGSSNRCSSAPQR